MSSISRRASWLVVMAGIFVLGAWRRLRGIAAESTPIAPEPRFASIPGQVRGALRCTRSTESARHRLGGEPDLPAAEPWPSRDGRPLAFIAQIDLADAARAWPSSPLPHEGVLAVFYDVQEQPWGFDPADATSHRVVWSGVAEVERRAAPATLDAESRFAPITFDVTPFDDPPSPDPRSALSDDAWGDAIEAREALFLGGRDALDLKVLGNPNPIQDEMELEVQLAANGIYVGRPEAFHDARAAILAPGASEWRLLLQVGSEGDMMWGDMGRLYVWIRESDLRERRFDRTWLVLQCG